MNRADVYYILMLGIANALVHQRQNPEHYQRQPNQRSASHSRASILLPARPSLYQLGSRSARNVAQQRQNEQNDKDIEKDLGHAGRRKSDSSKAKNCCYQCHDEKDQSPAQHKLNPPVHQGREQTRPRCQFPREVKIQLHALWGTQPT
jgi:hypothetical protein